MKNKFILKLSFVALFGAIISVGCFITIPIGVVPIVLQNALAILSGVLLGTKLSGAPTALFLVAGLVGLPVYAGGASGIGVWMGPTGGFLPGYLLGAIIAGAIAGVPSVEERKITWKKVLRISLAMFAGMVVLYIPGVIRFAYWAVGNGALEEGQSMIGYAISACVIPYIPGDLLKTIVAIPVALKVRPVLAQYLDLKKVGAGKDKKLIENPSEDCHNSNCDK